MKLPSVMKHDFSQVPKAEIPRSQFNRSHGFKTTFDAGYLVPIFVDEALPGDTFNLKANMFARLATPIVPFMDNLYADTFFFAVPIRLIWNNWQKFNGEQTDPGDSTDFMLPLMTPPNGGYSVGSLSDYFGIPTDITNTGGTTWNHHSLFHRAYNLIWNEWFRDQNLQDSVVVDKDDGPDSPLDYVLLRRGKRHDYFTSALPWPQKGDAVTIPLGTTAPIYGTDVDTYMRPSNNSASKGLLYADDGAAPNLRIAAPSTHTPASSAWFSSDPDEVGLVADLSDATSATINALRQAFQIQKLYERDARGGTRYTEIVRAHFGVTSPDARLQRPEFLGGGSTPININPIAQTSETSGSSPQGNLAAIGTLSARGHGFTKSFTEHCVVIGLVNVRADLNYQQGLNRMFSRSTRWDFYWPALAQIGEQSILNKEIYLADNASQNAAVFGYQERFAEYRYKPSLITGQFRSSFTTPLDVWHLAQDFAALPVLNASFIVDDPPVDRVIAVPSEPHLLFDAYFDFKCARPMPMYGVPGLIDHF